MLTNFQLCVQYVTTLLCVLFISGCATVTLPLCPRLAELSLEGDSRGALVNKYIKNAIEARNIDIFVMSPVVAEFQGNIRDVGWLEKHYSVMLCGFSSDKVINPAAVHITCLQHSSEWISMVKQKKIEDIYLQETQYKTSCYPRSDGS